MKLFSKIKDNPLLSFLIFLLVLAFGAFVGVLFCECIETYISNLLGLSNKNETLKFLGIGMGGILIALQALMSYKRAKATEDSAQAQADAVLKTEQGQQQERFRNAIEHLGHEKDSVRLGGAYELFHLAQDIEDLRQTVLDILCAHIRQTTGEYEYQKKHKVPEDPEDVEDVPYVSAPSEEVQSLLNLLFVQEHDVFKGLSADLRGSWMRGADLRIARLESAVLVGVHLQEANLTRANLQGVNLEGAQLQGANLEGANLQRANVTWTQLERTNLKGAKLQGADLTRANLQGVDLKGVNLQGVDLTRANLQRANLQRARLQGVVLWAAELQGADLTEAQLQAANLWVAKLQEANLTEAQLQGVISKKNCLISFEKRIRTQIGKESDLSEITFEGELGQDTLDCIVGDLPVEADKKLREKLTRHLDKPKSNKLPENSSAITGTYTREDAEKWIAEYNEAMSSVPKEDTN